MSDTISDVGQLEACIGAPGLPVKMKIIDHLDAGAIGWIAASPLAFAGFAGDVHPQVTLAGGAPGFANVDGADTLVLSRAGLDDVEAIETGRGAAVLFLVPGIGETLRVNGRVRHVDAAHVAIAVEECFVHCAKALIRSDFWGAQPLAAPDDAVAFLNGACFLALATVDGEGRIDISPKGDPAGRLLQAGGGRAILAERPGNKLAFGYRNILARPDVSAVALVPGATAVVSLNGRARLTTDAAVRGAFVVDGKTPILATVIDRLQAERRSSAVLERARLWTAPTRAVDVDPAAVLVGHVKLNKARGVAATAIRLAVNRSVVAGGLEQNYKTDLY
jgi:predicted pyridoxine 5'-phosphate oxidase superfamily flavin-nucleotide-binding protein